jgi:hypothetical protein
MFSNDNMLSVQNEISNTEIKNKGFFLLDEMFKSNGWHMTKNEMNWICYTRAGNETEFFDIKLDQKRVYVSVPIQNSIFQYTTSFKDYFTASEYVEQRFKDFTITITK